MERKEVYVLTATRSIDPTWSHCEVYSRREDAVVRMKELYEQGVSDSEKLIMESNYNEKRGIANATFEDDSVVAWRITEHIIIGE